jgi:hypothetical protein
MIKQILLFLSLLLAMLGGLQDVMGKIWWISKEHCWHDAQYLLLLVIALNTLKK